MVTRSRSKIKYCQINSVPYLTSGKRGFGNGFDSAVCSFLPWIKSTVCEQLQRGHVYLHPEEESIEGEVPHTRNFTLESTSKLPVVSRPCDVQRSTLASKATQEASAMEYDACIMILVPAGIHESSEIMGTLWVVSWFLFESVFVESSEIVRALARVSWFYVLPSGGRGNRGNRGGIKKANGVTVQMRRDMSKKWQCPWSDGGEDARVWRESCAKPWSLASPNASVRTTQAPTSPCGSIL